MTRAHKGIVKAFKFKARNENATNMESTIDSMRNTLYNLIRNNRNNETQRIQIGFTERFSKPEEVLNNKDLVDPITGIIYRKGTISISTNREIEDDKYHQSDVFTLYRRSNIRKSLDKLTESLIQKREYNLARLEGASNHKLKYIKEIFIRFHEINPPNTRTYIPTPKKLLNKNAIINPQNKDDKCFLYAIAISVYYDEIDKKHPSRISKNLLKCFERLNIDNIEFPPKMKDIEQFEKDNIDISITIFEYDGFQKIKKDENNTKEGIKINDVRVSPYVLKRKHLVELLIIKERIKDENTGEIIEKSHYTVIKNLPRLFHGSKYDKGLYYCKKCYCSFKTKEKLEKIHSPLCIDNENVLKIMPEKGKNNIVKFKDFHMQTMQPYMIIADFETYTNKLNQIKPYSFAIFTHCIFDEDRNELTSFTGKNCLDKFFDHLKFHVNRIDKIKARPNPYSNPTAYKNNASKTICLKCNNEILTDKPHAYRFIVKNRIFLWI